MCVLLRLSPFKLILRLIARITSSVQASLILSYVFSWGTIFQISLKRLDVADV